jgi:hypothetical protein
MKTRPLLCSFVCFALLAATAAPHAHHAFSAEFDAERPLKMTGTVTKIEWQNPHTWFYIDVKDDHGNFANWGMELASPNLLMRNGWTRSSMKIGDVVTIEGFHAKNGSTNGNARIITLTASGRRLFAGTSSARSEP